MVMLDESPDGGMNPQMVLVMRCRRMVSCRISVINGDKTFRSKNINLDVVGLTICCLLSARM